jgi:putative transposase
MARLCQGKLAVMMYVRYPLSLQQVEDLLFEPGIDIRHETVRFGMGFRVRLRTWEVEHG